MSFLACRMLNMHTYIHKYIYLTQKNERSITVPEIFFSLATKDSPIFFLFFYFFFIIIFSLEKSVVGHRPIPICAPSVGPVPVVQHREEKRGVSHCGLVRVGVVF